MSYDAIRERLNSYKERQDTERSEDDELLLNALHQLTVVLESDLTQIKVALAHVARLLEAHRKQ